MTTKKITPKKAAKRKTAINNLGEKVGHLAGEIAVGKDHLLAMAEDAIKTVKSTIRKITVRKKAASKNKVLPEVKASAKKLTRPAENTTRAAFRKKATTPKKEIKRVLKKVAYKAPLKKSAAGKAAVKKAVSKK